MRIASFGVFILFAMAASIPATAASLVTNGGFETGDFTGWTIAAASCGSDFGITTNPVDAESGIYAAFFNGSCPGSYDSFEQSVPTIAGQNYAVSFYIETQGSAARDLIVDWNGNPILNLSGAGTGAYVRYNFIGRLPRPAPRWSFRVTTPARPRTLSILSRYPKSTSPAHRPCWPWGWGCSA